MKAYLTEICGTVDKKAPEIGSVIKEKGHTTYACETHSKYTSVN